MTPAQARQLSSDFSKALEQETNEVIRANGMPIVKLLGELSKDMPDAEREYVSRQLPQNLFGGVHLPSNGYLEGK